jgi:ribonuclease G
MQARLHPETALHVLTEERDLVRKLEKQIGLALELRDDPLLKPDEFKLVVQGAEQDVTEQYAVA